ncbi:hypothetical protein I3843_07G144100 [Carya illinoinensis]|nr:hypothetical protein I3843_07G144100 [Carya illinoinensis]
MRNCKITGCTTAPFFHFCLNLGFHLHSSVLRYFTRLPSPKFPTPSLSDSRSFSLRRSQPLSVASSLSQVMYCYSMLVLLPIETFFEQLIYPMSTAP